CAVLHPLGDSPSESGRIHTVPGSGVDGAAGAKHHDGGVGMPERLPLSAARPRCEVLPIISGTDQGGECESTSIASKKPESELVRGTLGEVGERRMSVEADPVWRIVAAASVAAIYRTLPRGAQPPGQSQSDLVSFAAGGTDEHGSSAVSRTTVGTTEVLRKGSGIKVDGTAGHGLTISAHILRMTAISPGKRPPGPICHQRALRNEFWLRAATRTSFFTIVCCRGARIRSSI